MQEVRMANGNSGYRGRGVLGSLERSGRRRGVYPVVGWEMEVRRERRGRVFRVTFA
jgi:hypothetical protein